MKRLRRIKNACAVIALQYVSGIPEDFVLELCKDCGFDSDAGMEDEEWKEAGRFLGIFTKKIIIKPKTTLRAFIKKYPNGLFFVANTQHIFVMDDGVVRDPKGGFGGKCGKSRIIKQAWYIYKR